MVIGLAPSLLRAGLALGEIPRTEAPKFAVRRAWVIQLLRQIRGPYQWLLDGDHFQRQFGKPA